MWADKEGDGFRSAEGVSAADDLSVAATTLVASSPIISSILFGEVGRVSSRCNRTFVGNRFFGGRECQDRSD